MAAETEIDTRNHINTAQELLSELYWEKRKINILGIMIETSFISNLEKLPQREKKR